MSIMHRSKLFLPFFVSAAAQILHNANGNRHFRRSKLGRSYRSSFRPIVPSTHDASVSNKKSRMSIANMTCDFISQPLNHFMLPRDASPAYRQRYCVYDGFVAVKDSASAGPGGVKSRHTAPVFFYTGNESPLPEYINNTGLMWELAESMGAQVIFIEHRYEGESVPSPDTIDCLAYSSSYQALADYAAFLSQDEYRDRPVVAFGGSYGGMLSAWLRFLYPHLVAGAIAGSAPIFGFPRTSPRNIDAAWQVIQHGLQKPYPPNESNSCASNLLAAWPLIRAMGESDDGRRALSESFRLCSVLPANNTQTLIDWAQSPWFDMAEGSFPYPSGYIVFALTHNDQARLPAWPVQAACWNRSRLHQDLGVRFEGSVTNVSYTVKYGNELELAVDWDQVRIVPKPGEAASSLTFDPTSSIGALLSSVRDAVSVWFNVTNNIQCYNLTAAPNEALAGPVIRSAEDVLLVSHFDSQRELHGESSSRCHDRTRQCSDRMATSGSWPSLCCNEEMNLIITEARGMGRDCFWPPTHPRGTETHADVLRVDGYNETDPFCDDPHGYFGFPKAPLDPWATWMDTVYGGTRIRAHSNVVFSNGLLDPWSSAGVYAPGTMDPSFSAFIANLRSTSANPAPGLYLQNISRGMIALVMEEGGHHTDLMYSSVLDPPSVTEARRIEREMIESWIDEWRAAPKDCLEDSGTVLVL
jgi:pimeloyl-ACP methyl ester carboxylesterase